MQRHLSTIKLLCEWARWGAEHNIDYPTLSPMFGERCLKAPLFGVGYIPPDVHDVEQCVCRLYWPSRQILILRYQRRMTFVQMGESINRTRWAAKDRLLAAESEVHHLLQKKSCSRTPTSIGFAASFNTVSPISCA